MTQQACKAAITEIRKKYGCITSKDKEEIKAAVELLLSKLSADEHISYPLPVVHLLQQLGFDLFRTKFKNPNQSGLIAVDSSLPEKNSIFRGNRVVLVNGLDTTAHQRFTIAHELAHYIFHFDETQEATYYKAYLTTEKEDEAELLANSFAAELLMPSDIFVKSFRQYKESQGEEFSLSDAITYLSHQFDAPATAVRRRLGETGCIAQERD